MSKASWDGKAKMQRLSNHNSDYGKPVSGSKADKRGQRAAERISHEIVELCRIIMDHGLFKEGKCTVSFGFLFDLYTIISNKVVGLLLRARRHGLVSFNGEMLFQRRDDHVIITLEKIPEPLMEYYQLKFKDK